MNDFPPSKNPLSAVEPSGAPLGAACGLCKGPLASAYFMLETLVLCPDCKERHETDEQSSTPAGRFLRALFTGSVAGVLGAGLYYAIAHFTGYEFGLVAVVIGLMVGGAVRHGSRRRGGWLYQGLAIFLTYNAMVAMHIPAVFKGVAEIAGKEAAEVGGPVDPAVPAQGGAPALEKDASTASEALPTNLPIPGHPVLSFAVGLGALMLIVYAAPFLAGFENAIGWLIIGFALFEAWKINRCAPASIAGPFSITGPGPTS